MVYIVVHTLTLEARLWAKRAFGLPLDVAHVHNGWTYTWAVTAVGGTRVPETS